jgi:hypothetical protein
MQQCRAPLAVILLLCVRLFEFVVIKNEIMFTEKTEIILEVDEAKKIIKRELFVNGQIKFKEEYDWTSKGGALAKIHKQIIHLLSFDEQSESSCNRSTNRSNFISFFKKIWRKVFFQGFNLK